MADSSIFDHLVLAGGPPRSGTTLLAQVLSIHPQLALACNNRAYESWGLFRYANYSGLVDELRRGRLQGEEARCYLFRHITRDGRVFGIATSPGLRENRRATADTPCSGVARFQLPVEDFGQDLQLCLKSPEICFALPQLATLFPNARFALVYRPVLETAESMYRKGIEWPNAYQRRWNSERDATGNLVPPPNTPTDLVPYWSQVTDFQRCVIRATAFLRAMLDGIKVLPSNQAYLYYHPHMRQHPDEVLRGLAEFLGIRSEGFLLSESLVRKERPKPSTAQLREFEEISPMLDLATYMAMAEVLRNQHCI